MSETRTSLLERRLTISVEKNAWFEFFLRNSRMSFALLLPPPPRTSRCFFDKETYSAPRVSVDLTALPKCSECTKSNPNNCASVAQHKQESCSDSRFRLVRGVGFEPTNPYGTGS